jgi:type IV pilus assembly protein PilM
MRRQTLSVSLWNKSRCPIGLDLGTHSVRLLQLKRSGAGFAVGAAASRVIPADVPEQGPERAARLGELIKQMVAEGSFTGRRVVSCLPATAVTYKNLRLPRMPADELRAAVEWEAADRLKLPADKVQVQFFDAGEVRQGEELREEIILLAAEHERIREHVDMLARAELQPAAIDAVPGALARCLDNDEPTDADGPAKVVLDVGYASSKVLVVKSGRVIFFKLIDVGGKKLDQTVAQHLSLPLADAADLRRQLQRTSGESSGGATEGGDKPQLFGSTRRETLERAVFESLRATAGELAKEVGLCLRYYSVTFRGRRPEMMALTGGEAYEPHLARILAEGADIAVEAMRPLDGIDVSKAPELAAAGTSLSEWAVAVGLSKRRDERAGHRRAA